MCHIVAPGYASNRCLSSLGESLFDFLFLSDRMKYAMAVPHGAFSILSDVSEMAPFPPKPLLADKGAAILRYK